MSKTSQFKTDDNTPTGFIKARDVRYQLQGANVDPKVQHILEALCEQAAQQQKDLVAMAQIVDRLADICIQFEGVASSMKDTIKNMTAVSGQEDIEDVGR